MSKKNRRRQNINTPKIKSLLDIVICVYGRFDLLDRCLKAIPDATDGITYNIILVDNNSPEQAEADIFYQSISDNRQNIHIIRNKTNIGFPKACNQGVRKSNSPLLFMLNSDVILEPQSIKYMVQQLDNPKVGVVGMKLLFPEFAEGLRQDKNVRPSGKVQHVGLETNIRGEFYHIFLGWDKDHPKVCETRSTYAVTGAALMTRRILWERIKGFNEDYGLGCFEDVEYSLAVRDLGLDVMIEAKAVGIHYTNATAEKYEIGYPMERNRMLLLQRWANKLNYSEISRW
jgi:GT2 family glycosyltransferase